MRRRHLPWVATCLVAATAGLSACTSGVDDTSASSVASASSTATAVPPAAAPVPVPQEDVGEVPIAHDAGYEEAVATFGTDQVVAGATNAARVAHIALADCHRWTTGEVDPRLGALVAPEILTRALEELDEAGEYGGMVVPSLLSHLPTDDGNGNNQAAEVRGGCDDSAPLRFPHGPMQVRVVDGGDDPRLRITCACVTEVTLGTTRVGSAQDWIFTVEQGPAGWWVSDVAGVVAHVNWFPAPAA